jgi:NTE family protein
MSSSSDGLDDLERPLAFVLGGGSSLGASQVGELRALLERGIVPDFFVGTSVGAINAAFLARSVDLEQVDALEAIWRDISRETIFPEVGLWRTLRTLTGSLPSLASNEGLRSLVDDHIPATHDALSVPTAVIGTRVLRGGKVVFTEGELPKHVLISASIPIVFEPVRHDGDWMVDGGVASNIPILPAHQLGSASMVVLDPGHTCALDALPESLLGRAMHLMTLMLRHQSETTLHLLEDESQILYVPPPCPVDVPPHDFSQTDALIEAGYERAARFVDGLQIDGPGVYGHPHHHDGSAEPMEAFDVS